METPKLILIDTNILVYAINISSPKSKTAQKFLLDNQLNMVIAHQNILETIRVLTHPKFPKPMTVKSTIKALSLIIGNSPLIIPKVGTEVIALGLIKNHNLLGNRIFDAYLAATALSNNVDSIVTDNIKDFKKFPQLKIINPF